MNFNKITPIPKIQRGLSNRITKYDAIWCNSVRSNKMMVYVLLRIVLCKFKIILQQLITKVLHQ